MKRKSIIGTLVAIVTISLGAYYWLSVLKERELEEIGKLPPPAAGKPPALQWAEGRILVGPKPGLSEKKLRAALNAAGGESLGRIGSLNVHVVDVPPQAEEKAAAALARNPNIDFAELDILLEPNDTIPNDPYWNDPYFWHLKKIDAPLAWDLGTGHGIIVAVCDSGVDVTHPELAGKLVPGWNVVSNNDDTSPIAPHGTWVAGVVGAASNNATGVPSIAWDAQIMPVRVTNDPSGSAYSSDIAAGIAWAADNGARVVNASYYLLWSSKAVTEAANHLRSLGGLLFVSAGNYNLDPGAASNPSMVIVAATDENDARASFSNYGAYLDLAAPGTRIWSTNVASDPKTLYQLVSGTSFSSPLAAGTAALLMAAAPELSPDQVEAILKETAFDPTSNDFDPNFGYGRLDAGAAMLAALGTPVDTAPPTVAITQPESGSSVAGEISVAADASDDTAVTLVDLYANGALVGTDDSVPYQFVLDTTVYANGTLALEVAANDANGNSASASRQVQVSNQVPDTKAPTVAIGTPAASTTVGGTVSFSANASDDVKVAELKLYVGGSLKAFCNAGICSAPIDTTGYPNGTLDLRADAKDTSGNSASASQQVQVYNQVPDTKAPTVSIGAPAASATISGTVSFSASAADEIGVAELKLYIGGNLKVTCNTGTCSTSIDTTGYANGTLDLRADAKDTSGNSASASRQVQVNNVVADTTAPKVAFTSPTNGALVATDKVTVQVAATDNTAVKSLELAIDGAVVLSVQGGSLSYVWQTKKVTPGSSHSLRAVAKDAAGNRAEQLINVTVGATPAGGKPN